MAKKRMLLLYPGQFSKRWGYIRNDNATLVYVYSALSEHFDVEYCDLTAETKLTFLDTIEDIENYKKESKKIIDTKSFDIVGISCQFSMNYSASLFFANYIKEQNPNVMIVVGGYHAIACPEDFTFKGSPFDQVVTGEISDWLEYTKNGKENISSKEHKVKIDQMGQYEIQTLVPHKEISPVFSQQNFFNLGIYLSKGCPWSCNFCHEARKDWKKMGPDEAIETIKQIDRDVNYKVIKFYDSIFGVDRKWRREFLEKLVQLKLNKKIWLTTRVELIEAEDIEFLKQLDVEVCLGIDSFSEKMLKIMNKAPNPKGYLKKFVEVANEMVAAKVKTHIFHIEGHPGEDMESMKQDVDFLKKNRELFDNPFIAITSQKFKLFPGSPVYLELEKYQKDYGCEFYDTQWWKSDFIDPSQSFIKLPARNYPMLSRLYQIREAYFEMYYKESFLDEIYQDQENFVKSAKAYASTL
jgi:radical SAM superfamily enzyme YgiQ (UPF0313 family)